MRVLKWVAIVLGTLIVVLFATVTYLKSAAQARYTTKHDIAVDRIPIPLPLSDHELEELRKQRASVPAFVAPQGGATDDAAPTAAPENVQGDPLAGVDLDALAKKRALARGKHYLSSRAGCPECHGKDLAGGVVVENPAMGKWVAPNITRGGVIKDYKSEDWVRIIRHGIKPDGSAATMPSRDFANFSDQEIADIATYIESLPAVDKVMPPTELGPIFSLLVVNGEIPISAEVIDHTKKRPKYPPPVGRVSLELGKHLASTCVGCHGDGLSGGPIQGGDPNWVPAKNLTFHETGLAKWSLEDFARAMKEGVRPDGSKVALPMPVAYTQQLKDAEVESLYAYLKTLSRPYGQH
jgi:mono/diheme cytochrome c family protein